MITFRLLNLETDTPDLGRLLSLTRPESVTLEQVHDWWQPRQAEIRQTILALNKAGQVTGMADAQRTPSMRPAHFWLSVVVLPEWRRQGTGARLFENGVLFVRSQGGIVLESAIRDNDPGSLQFAERRGYWIERHSFDSVLDLASFEASYFSGLLEQIQAAGFRFFSLADLGTLTEPSKQKLYELNRITGLDNPGNNRSFPSYADFCKNVFEASWFHPADQMLATYRDQWAGLTALAFYPEGNYAFNAFTGVLPEYRGRGLATALKLQAIERARSYGAKYIRTNNDSQNAPMLAVNRKLGYQPRPGLYQLLSIL